MTRIKHYVRQYDEGNHSLDPSAFIVDAGTPLPERVCRDCAHYVPGKLEENCAPGPKSVRTVGPLWAACNIFITKTNNTMETTKKAKEMPATKVCKACGRELPAEAFGKHARSADGLQPICRECRSRQEKGNPKYGRRKKDGTVSTPAAPPNVTVNPSVTEIPDHDLVKELRRRGYIVTASKTIEL